MSGWRFTRTSGSLCTGRGRECHTQNRRAGASALASLPQGVPVRSTTGKGSFEDFLLTQQDQILKEAEALDGGSKSFLRDRWERDASDRNAGFGITAVLEDGNLLEKGACNVSIIAGQLSPERAQAMSSRGRDIDPGGGQTYSAAALSLVFHPANPFVPTLRADVRQFKVGEACWYGGGCDLTPAYLFEDDAREFHGFWKAICDKHGTSLYKTFKQECDTYFYIPARREHRGIGGIFFDDLASTQGGDLEDAQTFVREIASSVLESWKGIAEKRRGTSYSDRQRQWQLLRRGRYLEFNLLYDRGVKFGLGGRIESVMVSAPPLVAWKYNVVADVGSAEGALTRVLQKPRNWI